MFFKPHTNHCHKSSIQIIATNHRHHTIKGNLIKPHINRPMYKRHHRTSASSGENLSEVTEVPRIITPGGPHGRPGAMQGKPLRGRTATAHSYTTSPALPHTTPPPESSPRATVPTRLPNWDVTCLASLSPPRAIP